MEGNQHSMKAAILRDKKTIILEDIPDPGSPSSFEVRVKILSVGICGSDVHYYSHGRIGPYIVESPLILGHEACGYVEEIGDEVTSLSIGDFVALEPGIPCHNCKECLTGKYNLCKDVKFWATPPINGALVEYVLHPESFTYKLPDILDKNVGPLIEPLSVSVHALKKTGISPGDTVFVNGSGTVGNLTSIVAKYSGASVVVASDTNINRLELAKKIGVDNTIKIDNNEILSELYKIESLPEPNLIYECSGNSEVLNELIKIAAPGSRLALIGMGNEDYKLNAVEAMAKELEIYTIFRYSNSYKIAVEIAKSKKIQLQDLITDTFSIDEVSRAFEYALNPEPRTCKILIEL